MCEVHPGKSRSNHSTQNVMNKHLFDVLLWFREGADNFFMDLRGEFIIYSPELAASYFPSAVPGQVSTSCISLELNIVQLG